MISYFDNSATTRADDEIVEILDKYHTEEYYNPSARSTYSLNVANKIVAARESIANALGVTAQEITFTSGGTESNNLGILGCLRAKRGNIVVTAAEHSSVYNTVTELGSKGYDIRIAKVLPDGHIDVDDFVKQVDADTVLACFMHVNNETGAINDVRLLNELVKHKNPQTVTFSDGVQALGKVPVNLRHIGVDIYTFSGHKIHCSKGIGGLYVKSGVRIVPRVFGGGQEKGLRSGTEYAGGIIALARAVDSAVKSAPEHAVIYNQYKQMLRQSLSDIPNWQENCTQNVSPAIMSLAFADIKGEVLVYMLEQHDIIVGTGSACSSKSKQSRVARAIGLDARYAEGLLRISFSKYNTREQVIQLGENLAQCVKQLRKTMVG